MPTTPHNARRQAAAVVAALVCAACRGGSTDPPGAAPSTQAVAEPAPFANPPNPTSITGVGPDAGPLPEPLRADQELAPDVPRELGVRDGGLAREPRETRDLRELSGYAIQAIVRAGEGPPPP